ncbi:MAG: hypothetical protein O9972_39710 [Burkholderiales bacterium]|nr:hypothetical protein [Burkholderiales bacterium]
MPNAKNWRVLASAAPGYPFTIGEGGEPGGFEERTVALVAQAEDAHAMAAAPALADAIRRIRGLSTKAGEYARGEVYRIATEAAALAAGDHVGAKLHAAPSAPQTPAPDALPLMPATRDRQPFDPDAPDGYLEGNGDWSSDNADAVTWLADNHAAIRARLDASALMLAALRDAGQADSPNEDVRTTWWERRDAAIAAAEGVAIWRKCPMSGVPDDLPDECPICGAKRGSGECSIQNRRD